MKHRLALLLCATLVMSCHSIGGTARKVTYEVVHGWPRLPDGHILGQVTGIAVDSHNHVFVFHRAGREWSDPMPDSPIHGDTVYVFDGRTGDLISQWGANSFIMPHGLSVDADDNVWLTDVGLHQVFKLSHDGALQLTVGEAHRPGADRSHFNLPTDVAVLPDGRFYVSDGYENTRVVQFDSAGKYIREWGSRGSRPGEFDLPHGIAADGAGQVYVADRSNARIQVFDEFGRWLSEWKSVDLGRPYGVAVAHDRVYVVDGGDQPGQPPDRSRAVVLDRSGSIMTTFGRYGNYDGQFMLGHDIAVAPDGAVYVGDAWGRRVQKFLQRQKDGA